MNAVVRLTALVIVVALSFAPAARPGHASTAAPATAKNCFFVRNHLPCPCPNAKQARAVAKVARITAGAIGTAVEKSAAAFVLVEQGKSTSATQPAKH